MVQAADFPERDHVTLGDVLHASGRWRIFLQREMCARFVIVRKIAGQDSAQMLLAEYHHVVQAVAPDGSNQPLCIRVLPGTGRSRPDLADTHASDSLAERLTVDRIAIAQQPAGRRVIRKRLNDLLRGPGGRRMLRDVEVNDPPALMEKDDDDEQDSTRDGRYGEEIHRAQRRDVIREECSPCLRRRATWPPHQPGDGSL
jgi:hypothetical protein